MKKILVLFLIMISFLFLGSNVYAQTPLPADQAFQFSATARDNQTIIVHWKIAPNYYLYRARFQFQVIKPKNVKLGEPLLPPGIKKSSPGVGTYQVYKNTISFPIPVIQTSSNNILLQATYQGCSEKKYCYPPTTKNVPINLNGNYMVFVKGINVSKTIPVSEKEKQFTSQNQVSKILHGKNLFLFLIGFLGFGIMISFTPCVLPMIPILSSIIVGQGTITHRRAFGLSLAYVLGMAVTYAAAGVLFGYIGSTLQVVFQKTWLIILFSLVFVAMALSLFGFYQLQLPDKWRNKIAQFSQQQTHSKYLGVALMGCFSTLILSPCVTPPLVAVLGYVGHTGNALIGAVALFTMGIGMGVPLLLLGAFGPKLLPKAGSWMNAVENALGILMLAVAIWMLQRILPGVLSMLLWAALAIGTAIYMGALSTAESKFGIIRKGLGLILFIYGIILVIAAFMGNTNPLQPINFSKPTISQAAPLKFIPVKTIDDVEKHLINAKKKNKPVMLDFYADWCIACKEMETFTFSNPKVKKMLKSFILLQADVTANDMDDKALESYYGVIAPPTLIFFNRQGKEIKHARIIGEISAEKLIRHLKTKTKLYP